MNINFDKKLFCANYYWATYALRNENITYAFLYGGSSSGKTYGVVQAIIIEMLIDGCDTIIFKKTRASIASSIYKDCVNAIKQLLLDDYFDIYTNSIRCKNGSTITFKGLDDPEKIKGIAGFKRIIFDEITEGDYEDWMQLTVRMRGIKNQTFVGIFNPISETHWLKTKIFDTLELRHKNNVLEGIPESKVEDVYSSGRYLFVRSTYKNNYFVSGSLDGTWGFKDESTIERFEEMKRADYNYYRIYALAEWGKLSEGNEFYKNFKREQHVGSFDIDEDLALHISFDENVRPFFPMTVMQVEDNIIRIVDEIIGKSPNNNYLNVCKMFAVKYYQFKNSKIFLYGDATSRKNDARTANGYNLFQMIKAELTRLGFKDITIRTSNANPSVMISGVFFNRLLAGLQSYSLIVNDTCINTINDFLYLKEDKDGGMLKESFRDSDGYRCEKYGHCSDSVRYFVIQYLQEEYKRFNSKGNVSYTPTYIPMVDDITAF